MTASDDQSRWKQELDHIKDRLGMIENWHTECDERDAEIIRRAARETAKVLETRAADLAHSVARESAKLLEDHEEDIIRRSVHESLRSLLATLGVDFDKPESVDLFRRSLQFNQGLHKNLVRALGAFIFAVCGAMGAAVWNVVTGRAGGG